MAYSWTKWSHVDQVVLAVENLPANARDIRDAGLILGSGRSPGGGHGNPFQYSCLENPMDRGRQRNIVHRIVKSQTRLKRLSMLACMESRKMYWWTYLQGSNGDTGIKNRLVNMGVRREMVRQMERAALKHTLPYRKQPASGNFFLYDLGNSNQGSVTT